MIQRIQTIFLILIVLLFMLLLFIPIYELTVTASVTKTAPPYAFLTQRTLLNLPILAIACGLVAVIALVAIFMFKDRLRQMRLCRSGALFAILVAADVAVFPQWFVHDIDPSAIQPALGAWLLFVNIPLFLFAYYFIKKDENLVRSADRLR
ncbi:MAG TPA: DUF4293 domain-containing protein [Bacteroidia bacterium]|nr:DUF4293 domain-containing protein [Bacteroidia bacterium]